MNRLYSGIVAQSFRTKFSRNAIFFLSLTYITLSSRTSSTTFANSSEDNSGAFTCRQSFTVSSTDFKPWQCHYLLSYGFFPFINGSMDSFNGYNSLSKSSMIPFVIPQLVTLTLRHLSSYINNIIKILRTLLMRIGKC